MDYVKFGHTGLEVSPLFRGNGLWVIRKAAFMNGY